MSQPAVTRADFQHLAAVRAAEAKALLDAGLWDGAYYLAGYAVELALKACVIKKVMATDAFPEKNFSWDCYSHDLEKLVKLAGLANEKKAATTADPDLQLNWSVLSGWSEQVRYNRDTNEAEARQLYVAVTEPTHGVLAWIKQYS